MGKIYSALAFLCLLSIGCVSTSGPHIRLATATNSQIEAIQEESAVWYEFQPGDEVPFLFTFIGVAFSADHPVALRAKEHFWIVMVKNQPLMLSYDGESAFLQKTELAVSVAPGPNDHAVLVWFNHVGKDPIQMELNKLVELGDQYSPNPASTSPKDNAKATDDSEDSETNSSKAEPETEKKSVVTRR